MIDSVEIDDRITKCEKLLAADPKSQIFAALAEAYRKKGDVQKAQDICLDGLAVHPDYASARVVLAKIYLAQESYDLAWEEIKTAIASGGRTHSIDLLESEILIRKGEKAAALPILARLYKADPNNENVKSLVALMEEIGDRRPLKIPDINAAAFISGKKENRGPLSLSAVLNILRAYPGVLGGLAVSYEGLVLESRYAATFPKEDLAALSKAIFDGVCNASGRIDIGQVRETLIEIDDSKIWIIAKEQFLLVLFTTSAVGLGALKLRIVDLLDNMASHSEGESK